MRTPALRATSSKPLKNAALPSCCGAGRTFRTAAQIPEIHEQIPPQTPRRRVKADDSREVMDELRDYGIVGILRFISARNLLS